MRSLTQVFMSVRRIVGVACEHCEMSKTTVKYSSFNRFWTIKWKRSRRLFMHCACKRASRFALRLKNFLRGGFEVILEAIWSTNLVWFATIFRHWFWPGKGGGSEKVPPPPRKVGVGWTPPISIIYCCRKAFRRAFDVSPHWRTCQVDFFGIFHDRGLDVEVDFSPTRRRVGVIVRCPGD